MNKSNTVISLQSVSKIYEGPPPVRAINEVSIEIQDKEFVAIVGESGSGKTTLLNIIGLLVLSKEVRVDLNSYFSRLKSGEIKKYK